MKECSCDSRHKIDAIDSVDEVVINGKKCKKVTTYHQCNKCNSIWYTTEIK